MATKRPLCDAGDNSLIYIGAVTEEHPTAIPPANLKRRNTYQLNARAVPIAETRKRTAIQKTVFLRPNLSDGIPPNIAPTTVPIKAIETVRPCSNTSRPHNTCIFCSAPDITAVSRPKRKPPKGNDSSPRKNLFRIHQLNFWSTIKVSGRPVGRSCFQYQLC